MADTVYNRGKYRLGHGDTVWDTADLRMLLLETTAAGAYAASLNTVTDLLAVGGVAELTATGYARQALDTQTITEDDGNNRVNYDVADEVFANLGVAGGTDGSVVSCVVYDEGGGTDGTRFLVSYHDSGFPVVTNGQNLTIASPNDVVRLT